MNFLEIFLVINAFVLGVVVTLAFQYLTAHRESKKNVVVARPSLPAPVPAAVRERITKQAEANLQGIVNRTSLQLQHDLGATGTQLNKLMEKFGSEVLDDEMRLFRANVSDIRAATQGALTGAQEEITSQQTAILESIATRRTELEGRLTERQAQLEAALEQDFSVQKEDLTKRLNEKLNDAVLAFLLETLGHEVDLGAQTDYLIATLDEHKAELIGTVGSPTPAPRPSNASEVKK